MSEITQENGSERLQQVGAIERHRNPWDRQPGESAKAFAAFAVYRDVGPTRSLAKVGRYLIETTVRRGTLKSVTEEMARWSSRYGWVGRVEAFEIHQDRVRLAERERMQREMEERHLSGSQALLFAALARARGLAAQEGKPGVDALSPSAIQDWGELARVIETAVRIERLTRGLATDVSKSLSQIPGEKVTRLVEQILEALLVFVPEGQHDAAIRAVEDVCRQAH